MNPKENGSTSYIDIKKEIFEYLDKRNWKPTAEDIAKSIVLEASELLEHFQWDSTRRKWNSDTSLKSEKNNEEIASEVADVFWYLVCFERETGIEILQAVKNKLESNKVKFPEKRFSQGHDHKYYLKRKKEYRKGK